MGMDMAAENPNYKIRLVPEDDYMHPLEDAGLIAGEPSELGFQCIGKGAREGGKQKPCILVFPGQVHRAMQGDDGLASPG